MEGLGGMGVGITLGDVQSHVGTRVQSLRNELAVLSCPVPSAHGGQECRLNGDRPAGHQHSLGGRGW